MGWEGVENGSSAAVLVVTDVVVDVVVDAMMWW